MGELGHVNKHSWSGWRDGDLSGTEGWKRTPDTLLHILRNMSSVKCPYDASTDQKLKPPRSAGYRLLQTSRSQSCDQSVCGTSEFSHRKRKQQKYHIYDA